MPPLSARDRPPPRMASDGEADSGEFFGDSPQPALQLLVVGLSAGLDQLRISALLEEALGTVVLSAMDVGVGGGPQCRQGAHLRALEQQRPEYGLHRREYARQVSGKLGVGAARVGGHRDGRLVCARLSTEPA